MTDLPIAIRNYKQEDAPFIVDSWVNSMRYSTPAFSWVPTSICNNIYRKLINKIIDSRPELFKVLVRDTDDDQIFSWVCIEDNILHFAYTKEDFRGNGLMKALLPKDMNFIFTHFTKDCEKLRLAFFYKPTLFVKLIKGIDDANYKTLECDPAKNNELHGKNSTSAETGRGREARSPGPAV